MRIVHLSYQNAAGVPQSFASAERAAGLDSIHVAATAHDYGYPCDFVLTEPGRNEEYDALVREADVVVAYDHPWYAEYAKDRGKPVLFRGLGTATYDNHEEIAALRIPRDAVTLDLTLLGYRWQPQPVEALMTHAVLPCPDPTRPPLLVHAPTNRIGKGTAQLLDAAAEANLGVVLIEEHQHESCLGLKATADVLLDQIPAAQPHPERVNGYGTNGLESMARGQAVAGAASVEVRAAQEEVLGELPYFDLAKSGDPATLPSDVLATRLARLRDSTTRALTASRGLAYVQTYHDPDRVVRQTTRAMMEARNA